MTSPRRLPHHPDLEQLTRPARELLRAADSGDAAARARFRALPALARADDAALSRARPALHDAQSVIAREHGFPSWNELRARVEELTLEFSAAVDQFVEAATDGRVDRAERLLALHPGIAGASLQTALLLGNVADVAARLAADPALALRPGGPRDWEPLLYICYNSLSRRTGADDQAPAAIARLLLERGADPNTRFPWLHHGVRRPVLYGATSVTRSLPLAEVLLTAGADPNDGVTLPLAASGDNLPTLELLAAHGADPNQPWATDGAAALYAILQWARTPEGVNWLLDHGADPDPVFAPNGETPLHVVARRWDVALAERLVTLGADPSRPRKDGRTPAAVAQLSGNVPVAGWLIAHGARAELSAVDRLVAACSRGDRTAALAMLAERPELCEAIADEHYAAFYQAAERGDVGALEAMLIAGFDPNRGDEEIGKTALHAAGMAGQADSVRVLLRYGADVTVRDREFHGQPLAWAAEGSRSHGDRDGSHREAGRLLIEAGSPTEWEPGEEPADGVLEVLAEWRMAYATRPS